MILSNATFVQVWPPELTIYNVEEMKDSQRTAVLIVPKQGTITDNGQKLVRDLAEKNLIGLIDIGSENHSLGVKVKIRNDQFVLHGYFLPKK